MDNDDFKKIIKRREDSKRRHNLLVLLKLILDGKFDAEQIPLTTLYSLHNKPREEYISPNDRDTYNYGYMELDEMMAGSPNAR